MKLKEIADELVAGCREGRTNANLDRLYAADAVSVEASDMGGQGRETAGLDGIKGKHAGRVRGSSNMDSAAMPSA